MNAVPAAKSTFRYGMWLVFIAATFLIVRNSLPYLHAPRSTQFFAEKSEAARIPAWRAALVVHAGAGILSLASATLQFSRVLLRRAPSVHRWMGRIYAVSTLGLLCPTGFCMAFYAKGGLAGQINFMLLGGLTFVTTLKGVSELKAGRMQGHIRWMIRSFAMTSSAITFRTLQASLGAAGLSYGVNYMTSLWLSLAGNFIAGEWIVRKLSKKNPLYEIPHPDRLRRRTLRRRIRRSAAAAV